MDFKVSLRAARVNAEMTQKQAATAISVDATTVANWEKGKHAPRVDQLYQLCEIYGISIDNIFLPR